MSGGTLARVVLVILALAPGAVDRYRAWSEAWKPGPQAAPTPGI